MVNYLNFPGDVLFHLNIKAMNESIRIGPNVPDYFIDFSKKLNQIFDEQKRANECSQPFPNMDPGAVDRRAFTMCMFEIFNAEATRTGSAGIHEFSHVYPKLLLPIPPNYGLKDQEGTYTLDF